MQCIYCQNYEISRNTDHVPARKMTPKEVAAEIIKTLATCENRVGFVSASHYVYQMIEIIDCIRSLGVHPVFIYNSNGYDRPETLRLLEGKIDIYLPDFKYSDASLGKRLSGVDDYPDVALSAIREMYWGRSAATHCRTAYFLYIQRALGDDLGRKIIRIVCQVILIEVDLNFMKNFFHVFKY